MRTVCCIGAIAALIIGVTAGTADAAKKNKSPKNAETGLRAIQLQCFKEYGAWFDPQTKTWKTQGDIRNSQFLVDAVHACVKQRSGKDAPFVTQRTIYR